MDTTVKYFILIFVLVFDPLAICLVIATTQAIDSRKKYKNLVASAPVAVAAQPVVVTPVVAETAPPAASEVPTTEVAAVVETPAPPAAEEELIQMRFISEDENKEEDKDESNSDTKVV